MRFEASASLRVHACHRPGHIHRVRRRQTCARRGRGTGEGGITETDDPHGCIDISHGWANGSVELRSLTSIWKNCLTFHLWPHLGEPWCAQIFSPFHLRTPQPHACPNYHCTDPPPPPRCLERITFFLIYSSTLFSDGAFAWGWSHCCPVDADVSR